jgi:hypothetical protein
MREDVVICCCLRTLVRVRATDSLSGDALALGPGRMEMRCLGCESIMVLKTAVQSILPPMTSHTYLATPELPGWEPYRQTTMAC